MKPNIKDPRYHTSEYELSTGRKFYANNGLISIAYDGTIAEGYDGEIRIEGSYHDGVNLSDAWTPAEKVELADYMIGLWTAFKESK